ncbi:HAD family hydrolase [Allonocardiopsis opalescens]|uniref:Putative hydrolase of the HAD superfamily n=1 Tax=Allonocardiopsis opalescens TaxID=1144618 RepID=A0A2T0Q4V3_9ACTN|nr:HAD-IA family hydrolase [Allonocardiopsis opalescens]PRX98731.1 putative hydrolase of the HAD superfamily [Allonocardiopsis opalescens]
MLPSPPPRVLTFDVVGTLIDFETGMLEQLRSTAPSAVRRAGEAALLDAFGRAEHELRSERPELSFTEFLEPAYQRVAAEFALPSAAGEAAALRALIPRWPPFPDAVAALRTLGAHARLVALTNADRWALAHMSAALGEPFDDAVTADDVGVGKPDPAMFVHCLGRLIAVGHHRSEVLHVAQSRYHDIATARELGLRTCWVRRRAGRPGSGATPPPLSPARPDHQVRSLAELADALTPALQEARPS